jgi:histone H2A
VDPLNYQSYIHTISKQVHPSMHISADTLVHVNYLLVEFAKSVIRTADAMAAADKVLTLNLKEIKAAVPGLLPVDVVEAFLNFADSAVRSVDQKLLEGPKRRSSKSPQSPSAAPLSADTSAPAPSPAPSPSLAPVPSPAPVPAPSSAPASPAPATPKVSRSTKAGLIIPVSRVESMIRELSKTKRVGEGAPFYLAAIMEFLARDLLTLTGDATRADRIITLKPRHLITAISKDADLARLFGYWVLQQAQELQMSSA